MNKKNEADFLALRHCKDCGWSVISANCNDSFTSYKDAKNWDWWYYCSNKGCKNHEGEGVFQETPEWIESDYKFDLGAELNILNGIDIEEELIKMIQTEHDQRKYVGSVHGIEVYSDPDVPPGKVKVVHRGVSLGSVKNEEEMERAREGIRKLKLPKPPQEI